MLYFLFYKTINSLRPETGFFWSSLLHLLKQILMEPIYLSHKSQWKYLLQILAHCGCSIDICSLNGRMDGWMNRSMDRWVDRLVLDKGADWSCSGPLVPGSSSSPSNPSLPTTPRTVPSSDPSHSETDTHCTASSLFLHQGYAKFPHFSWPCQALLPPGSLPSLTLSYTV